jgi:hypothetical protein
MGRDRAGIRFAASRYAVSSACDVLLNNDVLIAIPVAVME